MKTNVHFTDTSLIEATNPITINLIGAGGTGSQVLTALARTNHALNELNHAGFDVCLWDDDTITEANLGRQLFADCELGLHKSVALINRINRFFGTNWKAETTLFNKKRLDKVRATITISCVDNVATRFEIAEILNTLHLGSRNHHHHTPKYWLDFGNSQHTGQVILATVGELQQPHSEKYNTIRKLPFVTEEYGELLQQSEETDNTPSCSLADALTKQDLFINSTLAQMGCSLLWNMLRNGLIENKGFFLNLKDFRSQPIKL
ncbi:PRTRC system ThiF family protein [Aquimarina longa]|uniref:PRTRC system ThiF family protein n=1 Tax=Aquimarina longa TaxID=1080221 RepID=UPI000783BDFC|nr:PRTRC system ThiF family protein [Aquimarina longa]